MFDSLCEQFGMSANAAINVFVKAVIRTRSIPFAIKAKESKEDKVTDEAIEAFENMCKTARENNIEMALDEINAEIKEVRRLRLLFNLKRTHFTKWTQICKLIFLI